MSRDRNVVEKVVSSLQNIGNFEISPLREDERGASYKASDSVRRISVAIRTVWPTAPDHLQRLLTQARLAQTVEQSNVAKVIGSGELDGAFFTVSSFSNGNTLRQNLIDGAHLNTWDLIDFARQVCVGLESAHSRGVVHHALHPNNVVLEFDGTTKILDFGLYRENDPAQDGFFRNARYLSPEQLSGQPVDRQGNFYSVAIMLYEIATAGQVPYSGETWEELARAAHGDIIEPILWNPSVPPGLNAAIMKALSRDRSMRFETGPELVRALEDYKSFDRVAAPEPPPAPKPTAKVVAINAAAAASPVRNPYATVPEISAPEIDPQFEFTPTTSRVAQEKPSLVSTQEAGVWQRSDILPPPPLQSEGPDSVPPERKKIPRSQAERLAYHFRQRIRRIDPWVVALTALILILSGFILRTLFLSYGGAPASDYKYQPVPSPSVAAPTEPAPALPPVMTEEVPATPTPAAHAERRSPRKAAATLAAAPAPVRSLANTGSVMITTIPAGARVVVDGRPDQVFNTPQLIPSLAEGVHTLTISKDGYAPATRPVQITAGARSNVAVQLDLPSGFLTVLSNPSTAYILIDGVNTGHVTPSQVPVTPGTHTLTLRKMGYLETSDSFTVRSGEQQSRNVSLLESGSTPDIRVVPSGTGHRLFGGKVAGVKVTVRTTPAGATVLVNGQTVVKPTPVDFALNPGSYVMEIQLSGYQSVKKTITVEPGKPLSFDEPLHQ